MRSKERFVWRGVSLLRDLKTSLLRGLYVLVGPCPGGLPSMMPSIETSTFFCRSLDAIVGCHSKFSDLQV